MIPWIQPRHGGRPDPCSKLGLHRAYPVWRNRHVSTGAASAPSSPVETCGVMKVSTRAWAGKTVGGGVHGGKHRVRIRRATALDSRLNIFSVTPQRVPFLPQGLSKGQQARSIPTANEPTRKCACLFLAAPHLTHVACCFTSLHYELISAGTWPPFERSIPSNQTTMAWPCRLVYTRLGAA